MGSLGYDSADGYLVFFGVGVGPGGDFGPAQTWSFRNGTWTNLTAGLSASPGPRTGAGLVDDVADGYLVLYGGSDPLANNVSALASPRETWTFHAGSWTNVTATAGPPPPSQYNAAMTYDAAAGVVLLAAFSRTAGPGGHSVFETWTFHGGSWTDHTAGSVPQPGGRERSSLAYDPADRESVLFGGEYVVDNLTQYTYNDTWVYRSGAWSNVTGPGLAEPPPASGAAMATAPGGHVVLIGGFDREACFAGVQIGCTPNATWLFDNGTWNDLGPLTANAPPAGIVSGSAAAWDPDLGASVLAGYPGTGIWWFRWNGSAPVVALSPHANGAAPGGTLNLTVLPLGGTPPYNLTLCSGGAACTTRSPVPRSDPIYWDAPFPTVGPQTASVRVTDLNGSTEVGAIPVPVYASSGPLSATLTVAPLAGASPFNVTIWVNVSGGAAPISTDLVFGDGNVSRPTTASPYGHSYACPGAGPGSYFAYCQFTVVAIVSDARGNTVVSPAVEIAACSTNQPAETCSPPIVPNPTSGSGWGGGIPRTPPFLSAYGLLATGGGLALLGIDYDRKARERREAELLRMNLLTRPPGDDDPSRRP